MKDKKLARLFYIMELLRNQNSYLSLDYIMEKLEIQALVQGDQKVSERTFYRDLNTLKGDPFCLNIIHEPTKGYKIESDQKSSWNAIHLLESFHILNTLNIETGLQHIMLPQPYSNKGTGHLEAIIRAVRDQQVMRFMYKKHGAQDDEIRTIEPYYIKQFNGLWYLIGKDPSKDDFRTFGLDRITKLETTGQKYKRTKDLDIADKFKESYGIYSDERYPLETIRFSVDLTDASYLEANPMHHSFMKIAEGGDRKTYEIKLRYTKDLLMALLSRCWSLELLEPAYIRKEYADILNAAYERNKENFINDPQ